MKGKNLLSSFVYIGLLLLAILGRSFVGLKILNFRIGEGLVAIGLISSLYVFYEFFKNKNIQSPNFIAILLYLNFALLISFNNSSLINTYIYKASSNIWTLNYFFIGLFFFRSKITNNLIFNVFKSVLILSYVFSVIKYPSFLKEFFLLHSDKFQIYKGSDLLALFVITIFFISKYKDYKYSDFVFFILISSIFLPLFLWMSKGAFYSALLFTIWEIIYKRKYFLESFFKTACLILVAALLFVQSSIMVQSNKYEINETGLALSNLVKNKNTIDSLFSLYFDDGRLYSTEGNLNWRLEIWQDVIFDLNDKDILLTGYGYDSVIPAMERPDRQGLMSYDKEQGNSMIVNENVHSYIVNILARGGLIQVVLIILFYLMLLYTIPPKRREHMLQFLIPFLLCSMFDIGMEGVQYPILFFLSLSYIAKHSTKG